MMNSGNLSEILNLIPKILDRQSTKIEYKKNFDKIILIAKHDFNISFTPRDDKYLNFLCYKQIILNILEKIKRELSQRIKDLIPQKTLKYNSEIEEFHLKRMRENLQKVNESVISRSKTLIELETQLKDKTDEIQNYIKISDKSIAVLNNQLNKINVQNVMLKNRYYRLISDQLTILMKKYRFKIEKIKNFNIKKYEDLNIELLSLTRGYVLYNDCVPNDDKLIFFLDYIISDNFVSNKYFQMFLDDIIKIFNIHISPTKSESAGINKFLEIGLILNNVLVPKLCTFRNIEYKPYKLSTPKLLRIFYKHLKLFFIK